ncbi:7409_t:CDS:2, partial [Racocetra persica]
DLRPLIDDGITEEDRLDERNKQANPNQAHQLLRNIAQAFWDVAMGLHGKTVVLIFISDLKTLEDAITAARRIEASNYYQNKEGKEELTTVLID